MSDSESDKKPPAAKKSTGISSSVAKPRDEKKRQAEEEKDRADTIRKVQAVTTAILEDPELYTHPSFKFIRNFVQIVSNDPVTFPPPASNFPEPITTVNAINSITKGVAEKLQNRKPFDCSNLEDLPVLLIGDIEYKVITHKKYDREETIVRAWSIDGDENFVLLRFDFILSSKMKDEVKTGSIIRLIDFLPIYFDYNDSNDLRVAFLVRNYKLIGQKVLHDNFIRRPKDGERWTVNNNNKNNNKDTTPHNKASIHNNNASIRNNKASICTSKASMHNNNASIWNNNASIRNNKASVLNNASISIRNKISSSTNKSINSIHNDDDNTNNNFENNNINTNNNLSNINESDANGTLDLVNNNNNNNHNNNNNVRIPMEDCYGATCSVHGRRFDQCITKIAPVESIVLHEA